MPWSRLTHEFDALEIYKCQADEILALVLEIIKIHQTLDRAVCYTLSAIQNWLAVKYRLSLQASSTSTPFQHSRSDLQKLFLAGCSVRYGRFCFGGQLPADLSLLKCIRAVFYTLSIVQIVHASAAISYQWSALMREPDQGGQYKSWELRRLNSMIYDKQRLQEPEVHPYYCSTYCSTYYICITTFSNQKSTKLGVFFFFFFWYAPCGSLYTILTILSRATGLLRWSAWFDTDSDMQK